MASSIDDLVSMGDVQSLYEILVEEEDWMTQLDAAEGLAKLRDKRGLEFLLSAEQSEEEEIREVAKEILDSPEIKRRLDDFRADEEEEWRGKLETARQRLQKGRKVFRYQMVYIPAGDMLNEDPLSLGFKIPALDTFGFEGWEVIEMVPRRRQGTARSLDENFAGAYFLLKREIEGDEGAELDKL